MNPLTEISYVNQNLATEMDKDLMSPDYGFVSEALMELAGLSCAQALAEAYPSSKYEKVIVIVGPGNNGGDGLVCARHLCHFGYKVTCVYPKQRNISPYVGQKLQCERLDIPVLLELPTNISQSFHLVVDAIFGYSFAKENGIIRPPFGAILSILSESTIPIASLDIPSGWDIDNPEQVADGQKELAPDCLISLGVPKLCAKRFTGSFHYLGGRFLPPALLQKYRIVLPSYPTSSQFVKI